MKNKCVYCNNWFLNNFLFIILFLVFFCFPFLRAQTFVVKAAPGNVNGVLIDAQTGSPIEAANFVLIHFRDSTKVLGTASDKEGKFSLQNIPAGIYNAKISCIGYKTRARKAMQIGGEKKETKLDTIKLEPRNFITSEIQITGERDRVIKEKDKYILRPDKELGNNALEFLENAPMVNVDIDDNIKVLGKNAVIYIDGVPAKSMGINDSRDLKMYSISEIAKIEVVPEYSPDFPEAREGRVINIITKKTNNSRYSGNVGGGLSTRNKYEGNAGLNYLLPGATISSSYSKDYSNQTRSNFSSKTITYNEVENNYYQSSENESKYNADNYRLSVSLFSDVFNSFSYNFSYRPQTTDNTNLLKNNSSNSLGLTNNIESNSLSTTKQKFLNNNLFIRGGGVNSGTYYTGFFSYMYNKMDKYNNLSQLGSYVSADDKGKSFLSRDNSQNTNNNFSYRMMVKWKIDSIWNMVCQLNGSYQKLTMDNDFYYYDNSLDKYFEKSNQKIRQGNSDLINSLFYSVKTSWLGFDYSFGFDLQSKLSTLKDDVRNYSYSPDFFSITPNLIVSYRPSDASYLSASYSKSIINPQNRQLNPYTDYSDSTNIVSGNPQLQQGKSNKYSMGGMFFHKEIMMQFGVSYHNENDLIEQITSIENDKITRTTYQNLGKSESYNAYVGGSYRISNNIGFDLYLSGNKNKYESFQRKNEGASFLSMLRTSTKFWILRMGLEMNYSSPNYGAQTKRNSVFYANANIRALFFDKSLTLNLKITDIFNSRNNNTTDSGNGFNFINSVSETTRVVSLNLSYYFHSTAKEDFDEKRAEEYSDDF